MIFGFLCSGTDINMFKAKFLLMNKINIYEHSTLLTLNKLLTLVILVTVYKLLT